MRFKSSRLPGMNGSNFPGQVKKMPRAFDFDELMTVAIVLEKR